ncbi:LacI family DNA-binding transcriptional regulator [Falsirhodobacter algicola]|uniref:Substrate-binding domain-containing protein n=1 Tax=Falsirhodobacter algicola TaxID=2692330 RepID=A0A8J8MT90_9RHOB|nr:LacI family DNA-binding transcriptional regulator [Falsirhodobacter algicola]QUS36300.1 substrate-binding domain-containing protein [Falsirhodobacter algicola]
MSVSIKDIARLCGVSTATVSRTLSHPDRVSEDTRAQVMTVVATLGYNVNSAARSLRRQRSDSVLAIVPDLGNPFFSAILAGMEEALHAAGIDLLIRDSRQAGNSGEVMLNHLRQGRVDGLICLDGALPEATRRALAAPDVARRVVFCCEWLSGDDGALFPSVRSDNQTGARLAIDTLVGLGHRNIAFLAGPPSNVLSQERRIGTVAALAAHGLELSQTCGGGQDFGLQAGYEAAQWLVGLEPRPTAVLCVSDQMAMGLIAGLNDLGVSVPRDISVIGFDDIVTAAYFRPALTTVRQNRGEIGKRAAELLMIQVREGAEPPEVPAVVNVPVELIMRSTVGPAP